MDVKLDKFKMPNGNPFEYDKLHRKIIIENLTNFLKDIKMPFVITVNGSWGTGKTVFIKLWKAYLNNLKYERIKGLYFDAWTSDFCEDPLIPLISQLKDQQNDSNDAYKELKKRAKPLLKCGYSIFNNLLLSGSLNYEDIESIINGIKTKEENIIESYENEMSSLVEFKSSLKKYIKSVNVSNDNPFVLFIDELDRCQPLYAIRVLERIKHLFDIEGLIFVLAIDKEQLKNSLRCVYGNDLDAEGYLMRFIDYEYVLPKIDYENYAKRIIERYGFDSHYEIIGQKIDGLKYSFGYYTEYFNLTLREMEKYLTLMVIICKNMPEKKAIIPHFIFFLIILRFKNISLYKKYVLGDATYEEVLSFIDNYKDNTMYEKKHTEELLKASIISGLKDEGYQKK